MAATSCAIYAGEYGNTIRARTHLDDIGDNTGLVVVFKNSDGATTATLSATVVDGDTTYYAVDATVTNGWSDDKAGTWIGQVKATFGTGIFYGTPFTLYIKPTQGV